MYNNSTKLDIYNDRRKFVLNYALIFVNYNVNFVFISSDSKFLDYTLNKKERRCQRSGIN